MRHLRLSDTARSDLERIWWYTYERYGMEQAEAYDTLLWQALEDIEEDPGRPTSRPESGMGPGVRSYHISLSRKRSGARIGKPRHVVFYTLEFEDEIFVMRIIKDDMDAPRHFEEVD